MNVPGQRPRDAAEPGSRPRVLLISADPAARGVVAGTLRESDRFDVSGEAASTDEALRMMATIQPDVILLEAPPDGAAIGVILQALLDCAPATKIVILAPEQVDGRGLEALRGGAAGFLGKELDRAALVRTVSGVAAGEAAISRRFATWLIGRVREDPERRMGMRPVKSRLTTREWEVLDLATAGISKAAIARDLRVTVGTVRSHLRSLARKLSVDERELAGAGISERTGAHAPD
jgi:DNA-binding NarL/FixJ family response regulator